METARQHASRFCTICGEASSADATFCRSCGKVLEIPPSPVGTVYCERCGGEISLGDTYCPTCGEPQFKGGLVKSEPAAPPASSNFAQKLGASLSTDTVVEQVDQSPNFFIRVLWFVFIGSWLGPLVWFLSILTCITVVGAPIGLNLLKSIPFLVTLKSPPRRIRLRRQVDGSLLASEIETEQLPFRTRALYFGLVGWWFSLAWIVTAWVMIMFVLPIPLAMWMYDKLPMVTSLEQ